MNGGWGGGGDEERGKRKKERRRRKIEEDHEDGCIGRDAGDAGDEERATSRLRLEPLR